ncbi:MAG: penicillin-binding protein 2 [Holosporales bacterium]|jgi:penicillin-binding protein 2|nr:penicillin-binding protein 2 [Holosporales bacterium]
MSRRLDEKRLFTRRAFMFATIKTVLGLSVISRLAYLQIFKSKQYRLLSDKNRIVATQILPSRGNILDTNEKIIATNKSSYSVILDLSESSDDVVNRLTQYVNLEEDVIEQINSKASKSVLLQENTNWENLSAFRIASSLIPGINIEKSLQRHYNDSLIFSHIIGYTGSPTKEDIEHFENLSLRLPTAKIGKCGIEKNYDKELFGRSGIKHTEVNSKRQFVRVIDEVKSVPGEDIHLTIDKDLQEFVYNRLSTEQSSACVVMDVNSGAVLACVSYPGYDSNIFNQKIDRNILKELYENPYKPMINKAISGLYAPGSAFKMVVGLTGLHNGVINKHTKFDCDGIFEIGAYRYHCWRWKYGGHGSLDLQKAIERSCDIYFYNVAMRLSPDNIAEVANDFGLGIPTGIDIPGEKDGLIPTKAWKRTQKKQKWTKGDTVNMSIGQGYTLATPLQMTRMISILVNGLYPITPYICKLQNNYGVEKLKYKKEHIDILLSGMNDVVNSPNGTAYRSHSEELEFGGKTGSSQVRRITEQQRKEYKTTSDEYLEKEHAVFVGYAPVDEPRVAVCVLVEHGGGGAKIAAPIARDILLKISEAV